MSATLSRIERYELMSAQLRLAESSPLHQAEAIARHYLSVVGLARDLMDVVKLRRYGGDNEQADAIIAMLVAQLKRAHRSDLGIELEWPHPDGRLKQYRETLGPLSDFLPALEDPKSSTRAKSQ